jgi:hypothetical protein
MTAATNQGGGGQGGRSAVRSMSNNSGGGGGGDYHQFWNSKLRQCVHTSEYSELTRGPSELVQHFRLWVAQELLDPKLIWFGYITRLSQWGGGGQFTRSNFFYLCRQGLSGRGEGVSTLCYMQLS